MKSHPLGKKSKLTLEFHGGAQEVTGACYLLRSEKASILVDCGMFQGSHVYEKMNRENFTFDPRHIDAVFITHSHIDHIGRLPRLVQKGFSGKIYSTAPTKDLAVFMLEDSLHFMRKPKEVLFDKNDIKKTFLHWDALSYYSPIQIGDMKITLRNSGHILGSAMVEVEVAGEKVLFSGDFGNVPSVLLPPPDEMPEGVTYLIIEATYGNRVHEDVSMRALQLERAIEDVATKKGVLMLPVFATERTQDILYELNEMVMHSRVPSMPVFVDSPLAIKATDVFKKYPSYYNDGVKKMAQRDPRIFDFKGLRFTESVDESKKINDIPSPKVILAGSGMSAGGRIVHHERRYLQDPNSILLLVGYQSAGSLGRRLLDGIKEVKIFDEIIPVRAEIRKIAGYSAHADNPQLFHFIKKGREGLKKVFVVQGEPDATLQLSQDVKDQLGVEAEIPRLYDTAELG